MTFEDLCRYVDALSFPRDEAINFMSTSDGLKMQLQTVFEESKRKKDDIVWWFDGKEVQVLPVTREDYERVIGDSSKNSS